MANTKTYSIVINGITESIDAVKSLEKELFNLEQKIKELESRSVNVKTSSSGGGGSSRTSNAAALNEEEQIQREINKLKAEGEKLDAKIAATQDEIYKRVDATKQLYKETVADQKALAAAERLQADAYSNTMQGMKSHLADLKAVINTTDLGDGDKIKQMTEEANKLNEKLLEIEKSYGQFGRQVGNYPDAGKNLQAIVVTIGGVDREFNNAREATRTLNNELKAMAVQGKENTKEYEELRQKLLELESTMNDAKKPMDGLMDTMESITAIASVSKGLGAFFGADTTEIQKSMQQLLALQTALKGLQAISKQIETREGIGAWIAPFTTSITKATAKLLTFNTALLGTGRAAKIAAVGIKTFSKALKVAFSAGVLIVVDLLIEGLMNLVDKIRDVSDEEKVLKESTEAGAKAYAEATANISAYKTKLDNFNGSKAQEKKLVEELNSKMGSSIGQYKTISQWQAALTKKAAAYAESMKLQAQAQALLNAYSAQYVKIIAAQQDAAKGGNKWAELLPWNWGGKSAQEKADDEVKKLQAQGDAILSEYEKINKQAEKINKENGLFDYAPQIKKNSKNTEDALKNAQNSLNNLQLRLMQDGLNKKLRQLDEEERQTLDKLRKIGKKTADEQRKTQETYNQLRLKEIKEYLKNLEKTVKDSAKSIAKTSIEIDVRDAELGIERLQNKFEEISKIVPSNMTLTTRTDLKNIIGNTSTEDIKQAYLFDMSKLRGDAEKYNSLLDAYLAKQRDVVKKQFEQTKKELGENAAYDWIAEKFEKDYARALSIVRSYNVRISDLTQEGVDKDEEILSNSFRSRLFSANLYYEKGLKLLTDNIKKREELEKTRISGQAELQYEAERDRYTNQVNTLSATSVALDNEIALYEKRNDKEAKILEEMKNKRASLQQQMIDADIAHSAKMQQITDERNNNIKKVELSTQNEISSAYEKYYNLQITNYREFQSKLNNEMNKNPIADKNWGIVNIAETKRNYREVISASETTLRQLQEDKKKLNDDYRNGLISDAVFNETLTNFNDLETSVTQGLQETNEKSKQVIADFIQSIDQYLQAVVGSFSQIMSAVWDAQDIQNEKEAEALDKQNEILDKKLDEQQEIVEKHKSKIDSIEDELATARGDRRQHLIDQLNAEMAAQREAQAQEKKIQKEKEANEKKQDELEKKRKKQQYQRDMIQAVVNGAMAVTYALVNKWPVPAIPMAALAASTAAAQIGIMAANKPYAKGGLLEGKSHAEGGIPVGNTGIEVEGKEYIIRKKSTAPNIEILDYINKSERKLDLDDFIDFYSSGKVKKNISQISPKSRFADGGTIPTLSTDYSFDDRLLNAFEDYSNRPVVVSVRDINARQAAVRDVQVLAGLDV